MSDTIWRDDPPTEPGWYWVDISGADHDKWATESQVIGWLRPTGWKIPFVGFGLDGDYLRDIGIRFGPRVPDPETCARIERGDK